MTNIDISTINIQEELTKIEIQFYEQFRIWLETQLTNNDFLIAGVFTVILSTTLYLLRNVPLKIWDFLKYRFSVKVSIFSDNPNFYSIAKELNKNTIHLFSRRKMLDSDELSIGLGTSISRFNGYLVGIQREQEKSDSYNFKQTITLTFPFMTNNKLKKLFENFIEEKNKNNHTKMRIYKASDNNLIFQKDTIKRGRESIFLPDELLDYIETRINFFLNNKKWYTSKGIPYKYAILLHGVPGTGKTTLAKYIASFTDRNLILIAPSVLPKVANQISRFSNDEYDEFGDQKNSVGNKFIGLMEDIDCDATTSKRKVKKQDINTDDEIDLKNKISFTSLSDLLNSIDGLNAPEDFILVATTNHLNDLDPALFRKGRFDDVIDIKPLSTNEIKKMICSFREINISELDDIVFDEIPGSILQDLILQYLDAPLIDLINAIKNRK